RRQLADREPGRRGADPQRRPAAQSYCKRVNVVFTGGGTGGHLYPAIAIADALRDRANILFIGSADRLEATIVPNAGYALATVESAPLSRRFSLQLFRTIWSNARGV